MSAAVVNQNSEQSSGYLLCISIAMFLSCVTIGLPLTVTPESFPCIYMSN